MDLNQFDLVAPFYDALSRLVFGDQIVKSQTHFLHQVRKDDQVLLLGGGTGQILEAIPACSKIFYLDKSRKMIKLARRRSSSSDIEFLNKDFFDLELPIQFDKIICPFFLDCFSGTNLSLAISKIESLLADKGVLIVTDFEDKNMSKFLDKVMHTFFKVTSKLESNSLKPIDQFIHESGFEKLQEKFFHRNMIFSRVYRNL